MILAAAIAWLAAAASAGPPENIAFAARSGLESLSFQEQGAVQALASPDQLPEASPRLAATVGGVTLDIVTFNVGLLSIPGLGDIVPAVTPRSWLIPGAVGAFAQNDDIEIFMIEELWDDRHAAPIRSEFEKRGYHVLRPPHAPFPFLTSTGLLLAVKDNIEILSADFLQYEYRAGYEKNAFRGMLICLMRAAPGAEPFVFIGTHMQSVPDYTDYPAYAAQRREVDELGAAIKLYTKNGRRALLIAGDLNMEPWEQNYKLLTSRYNILDAYKQVYPDQEAFTMVPSNPLTQTGVKPLTKSIRIDHVLVRDGQKGAWKAQTAAVVFDQPIATPGGPLHLSDHFGMRMRLVYLPSSVPQNPPPLPALVVLE